MWEFSLYDCCIFRYVFLPSFLMLFFWEIFVKVNKRYTAFVVLIGWWSGQVSDFERTQRGEMAEMGGGPHRVWVWSPLG